MRGVVFCEPSASGSTATASTCIDHCPGSASVGTVKLKTLDLKAGVVDGTAETSVRSWMGTLSSPTIRTVTK